MGLEIEYKFLVKDDSYKSAASGHYLIQQGYLCGVPERTVRIRIVNDKGFLTVKGKNEGEARVEYEYEIPVDDARGMLKLCERPIISKIRWIVDYYGYKWEIDEFEGNLKGLVLAEVEVPVKGVPEKLPDFIGENVTGDPRYYNSMLTKYDVNDLI